MDFKQGDRVKYTDYRGLGICFGRFLSLSTYGEDSYIIPDSDSLLFGDDFYTYNGALGYYKNCYLLRTYCLEKVEEEDMYLSVVERKVKSLENRFKSKTLTKTKMKPLPFPKGA